MRLAGKVALVTGSSQGIGESIARRFAADGARVAINYSRNAAGADAIAAEIVAQGGYAKTFRADCSRIDQVEQLVGDVAREFGGLDILVNNAGAFRTVPIEETTEKIWDEQLNLNLRGPFFAIKAAVPHFRKRGKGKVINITSIFGTGAGPNCAAYCASKGGLVNLTRALACELGRERINVNSLAPGNIATPLNAHLRTPEMSDYVQLMRTLTPTGRDFLQPDELTGTAVYLASDDSDAVHGTTILVDAGWSAW